METLNFVQVELKPRSKSLKIAYFGRSRRVQEASSAFSRNFCRFGWTNISTLLSTVSGVCINIQHKQLVEFKTTEPPGLIDRVAHRTGQLDRTSHGKDDDSVRFRLRMMTQVAYLLALANESRAKCTMTESRGRVACVGRLCRR